MNQWHDVSFSLRLCRLDLSSRTRARRQRYVRGVGGEGREEGRDLFSSFIHSLVNPSVGAYSFTDVIILFLLINSLNCSFICIMGLKSFFILFIRHSVSLLPNACQYNTIEAETSNLGIWSSLDRLPVKVSVASVNEDSYHCCCILSSSLLSCWQRWRASRRKKYGGGWGWSRLSLALSWTCLMKGTARSPCPSPTRMPWTPSSLCSRVTGPTQRPCECYWNKSQLNEAVVLKTDP